MNRLRRCRQDEFVQRIPSFMHSARLQNCINVKSQQVRESFDESLDALRSNNEEASLYVGSHDSEKRTLFER